MDERQMCDKKIRKQEDKRKEEDEKQENEDE